LFTVWFFKYTCIGSVHSVAGGLGWISALGMIFLGHNLVSGICEYDSVDSVSGSGRNGSRGINGSC
jgi:hypothetical protein